MADAGCRLGCILYSTGETDMALEMRGAEAGNPFGGHGRPVFGRDGGDRLEVCLFLDLSRSRIHPLSLPHSDAHIHAHAHTHIHTHTHIRTHTNTHTGDSKVAAAIPHASKDGKRPLPRQPGCLGIDRYTRVCVCVCFNVCVFTHECMRTHTHTQHTYTHTHSTHTHTHTHAHTARSHAHVSRVHTLRRFA